MPAGCKDDVLCYVDTLSIRYVEGFGRLDGEAGVVLEVDAGADFPGQLVGAVHFENVCGVEVQVVVLPVDAVVGIGEVVARWLRRRSRGRRCPSGAGS